MGVDLQTYRAKIGTYRHSCGTDVVSVTLFINFSQGLKNVGSVLFIGLLLIMAGVEQNPGPKEFDKTADVCVANDVADQYELPAADKTADVCVANDVADQSELPAAENAAIIYEREKADEISTKIRVSEFPENVDEEMLVMFSEKADKESCGKTVDVVIEGNLAFVELEETTDKTAELGVASGVADLSELPAAESEIADEITYSTKIKVSGLPENVDEEILAICFEKKDNEGCAKVVDVVIDAEENYAVIEFEEAMAAQRFLKKRSIDLFGTIIDVEEFSEALRLGKKSTKL